MCFKLSKCGGGIATTQIVANHIFAVMDIAGNNKMSRLIYTIEEYNRKVETEKGLVVVHYINNKNNTKKEQFHPKNKLTYSKVVNHQHASGPAGHNNGSRKSTTIGGNGGWE
jgi:hypothetical protein